MWSSIPKALICNMHDCFLKARKSKVNGKFVVYCCE